MEKSGYRGMIAFPEEYTEAPSENSVPVRRDAEPDRGLGLILLAIAPLASVLAAISLMAVGAHYADYAFGFAATLPSAVGIALAMYARRLANQDLLRVRRGEIYPDPEGQWKMQAAVALAQPCVMANIVILILGVADGIARCL